MATTRRTTGIWSHGVVFGLSLLTAIGAGWAAADSPALFGSWVLNSELTREVQPEGTETHGSGGFNSVRPSVSVGGMPVPLPTGDTQEEYSSAGTRDPKVLRCTEFDIEHVGDDILLTYQGAGREILTPGNVQGTRTKVSSRKLATSYQTTTRKVSKTFELRDDGRLLVTVKLNPKQGATVVHKRVFDRRS